VAPDAAAWARRSTMRRLLGLLILAGLLCAAFYHDKLPGFSAAEWSGVSSRLGDAKTKAAVSAALRLNRATAPWSIDVDAQDGVVSLTGSVPSSATRATALRVAASGRDVRHVVDRLEVVASLQPPPSGGRTMGESLDDHALEAQVRLAFSLDTALDGADLQVSAFRHEVTLAGEATSAAQRQTALEIARATGGVASVVDQIRLRDGSRSAAAPAPESERLRAVRETLAANGSLARYRFSVGSHAGALVLRGDVETAAERDLAGLLATNAWTGAVENRIQVKPKAR
jgi:osmotically-inducible protein OsmY